MGAVDLATVANGTDDHPVGPPLVFVEYTPISYPKLADIPEIAHQPRWRNDAGVLRKPTDFRKDPLSDRPVEPGQVCGSFRSELNFSQASPLEAKVAGHFLRGNELTQG